MKLCWTGTSVVLTSLGVETGSPCPPGVSAGLIFYRLHSSCRGTQKKPTDLILPPITREDKEIEGDCDMLVNACLLRIFLVLQRSVFGSFSIRIPTFVSANLEFLEH